MENFLFFTSFILVFLIFHLLGKGQERYENYQKKMKDREGDKD